jgi:hypothetical protein
VLANTQVAIRTCRSRSRSSCSRSPIPGSSGQGVPCVGPQADFACRPASRPEADGPNDSARASPPWRILRTAPLRCSCCASQSPVRRWGRPRANSRARLDGAAQARCRNHRGRAHLSADAISLWASVAPPNQVFQHCLFGCAVPPRGLLRCLRHEFAQTDHLGCRGSRV